MQNRSLLILLFVSTTIIKACSKSRSPKTKTSEATAAPDSLPPEKAILENKELGEAMSKVLSEKENAKSGQQNASQGSGPANAQKAEAGKSDAQEFNAQLKDAVSEAAAKPGGARSSALTARRAAKLKAVHDAQSATSNNK